MKYQVTVNSRASNGASGEVLEVEAFNVDDAEEKAYEQFDSLHWFVAGVVTVSP